MDHETHETHKKEHDACEKTPRASGHRTVKSVQPVSVPEAFGFACFVYFVVNPSELLRLSGRNDSIECSVPFFD